MTTGARIRGSHGRTATTAASATSGAMSVTRVGRETGNADSVGTIVIRVHRAAAGGAISRLRAITGGVMSGRRTIARTVVGQIRSGAIREILRTIKGG